MTSGELVLLADPGELAQHLADLIVSDARAAIQEHGRFRIALAGGTTPKAAYALLAAEPRRSAVEWGNCEIYFSDERCVPPESSESNYRMAAESLLQHVPIPREQIHRMEGEDDPPAAAHHYADLLIRQLGDPPRLDTVLLGMGADGHTASLFPGTDPLTDNALLVRAPFVAKLQAYRLTLTPLVINNASHVVIAVEGLPKASALYAVREGAHDPVLHPIQIVAPSSGRLTWLTDRAAAAEIIA